MLSLSTDVHIAYKKFNCVSLTMPPLRYMRYYRAAIAFVKLCQSASAHRFCAMLHAHICCVALRAPLTALQH